MFATLVLPLLLGVSDPPSGLQNAKVVTRVVAPGGLAVQVKALTASRGPQWIGYSQPVIAGKHRMCCFRSLSESEKRGKDRFCCGGCALERDTSFTIGDDDDRPVQLEGSPGLVVLLRAERGRIGKVRAFDDKCGLDAGGLPFFWLTGVRPEESVALLGSIVRQMDAEDRREDAVGSALAAVALTAHPSADALFESLLARGQPRELRKKAAFWTGNSRGQRGFEMLRALVPNDPDAGFRREGTFALSQSPVGKALDLLISMARNDPDGEVRGQALFWLAQKAGDRAVKTIEDAIRDDPEEDVKKKAVFALSQLPKGEAVLIRVARTNRNAEVRKQAIFWLGQTKDPRALAFIEEILDR